MSNAGKDDLRPEYDLDELRNKAVGKYYESYKHGVSVVVIDRSRRKSERKKKA
jgi:hypothetical protein